MNPVIRAEWLEALRSDEYQQGKGALTIVRDDGTEKDCCLGVLCKLAVKAGVLGPEDMNEGSQDVMGEQATVRHYAREIAMLPAKVMTWAGLASSNPYLDAGKDSTGYQIRQSAAVLNDSGRSFTEIAFAIESTEDL
jgi:hypothetical protein